MNVHTTTDPRPARELDALEVQRAINAIIGQGGPPGMAVAGEVNAKSVRATGGETVVGRGQALDDQARFPLGCLIKPLLSLICLELHVRGELDIHRPVSGYLPELASDRAEITLAHLLSHTGGYIEPQGSDARWKLTWEAFVEYFRSRPQAFEPGAVWSYTQTGHAIIGRIVEQVTGQDPLDLIEEAIFRPLGIEPGMVYGRDDPSKTCITPHMSMRGRYVPMRLPNETGFFRCSISNICVTVSDWLALGLLMVGEKSVDYVSAEAAALLCTPVIQIPEPSGGGLREASPSAYGLGLGHYGRMLGHNGSYVGTTGSVRYDRATRIAFAVTSNAWSPGLRDRLNANLLELATGDRDFLTPSRCRTAYSAAELAGRYQGLMLGMGEAVLELDGDKLNCRIESPSGPMEAELRLDEGRLAGKSAVPWLSLAFGEETKSGKPYLMVGAASFKKVDA